jgi:hypothetical protein
MPFKRLTFLCVFMVVMGIIFFFFFGYRNPAPPPHHFEDRHVVVGGPLSFDNYVLFLALCESSSFKTIVLTWPASGDPGETLTMCFAS